MQLQVVLLSLLAAVGTNAAVVDLFSDPDCRNPAGSRNVWDRTCAPLGGFQSYRITAAGGNGQFLSAYNRNACAGQINSCVEANRVGTCFRATGNGGSNAFGSGRSCGLII